MVGLCRDIWLASLELAEVVKLNGVVSLCIYFVKMESGNVD